MSNNISLRRIIYLGFLLVGLLIMISLHNYLASEKIIIVSERDYVIKLNKVGDTDFTKQGNGSLSARVKPGDYTFSVESRGFATNRAVHIKARQTLKFDVRPPKALVFEPVLDGPAAGVNANDSRLLFIDP